MCLFFLKQETAYEMRISDGSSDVCSSDLDASEELARLLSRCSLGDQGAFADLYEATAAKLFGVALRMLRREAWAEEALQEAFVKIWRHAIGGASGRERVCQYV